VRCDTNGRRGGGGCRERDRNQRLMLRRKFDTGDIKERGRVNQREEDRRTRHLHGIRCGIMPLEGGRQQERTRGASDLKKKGGKSAAIVLFFGRSRIYTETEYDQSERHEENRQLSCGQLKTSRPRAPPVLKSALLRFRIVGFGINRGCRVEDVVGLARRVNNL